MTRLALPLGSPLTPPLGSPDHIMLQESCGPNTNSMNYNRATPGLGPLPLIPSAGQAPYF